MQNNLSVIEVEKNSLNNPYEIYDYSKITSFNSIEKSITEESTIEKIKIEESINDVQPIKGIIDVIDLVNYDVQEISFTAAFIKIIKKETKFPIISCIAGIIISSIIIPFPFSAPLVMAIGIFLLTLILYRHNFYKEL